MFKNTILCVPRTSAIRYAIEYLEKAGLQVTTCSAPDVSHVLLPVPSFTTGDSYLAHLLADLPNDVVISGGNLTSQFLADYTTVDFLQDPYYLAENAAITAECTLQLITGKFGTGLQGRSVLLTGWGRIGKCLCHLLERSGAAVTVAVRRDADRAMIRALGYRDISIEEVSKEAPFCDIIINTVPAMVLPHVQASENALIMELASNPGISGEGIIDCRGLPNKMAPMQSGRLIAETFLRLSRSGEV